MNRRAIQRPRIQLTQPAEAYKRCWRKNPHYYTTGEATDLPPAGARQQLLELLLKPNVYDRDRLVCYPCGNHWHVGHRRKMHLRRLGLLGLMGLVSLQLEGHKGREIQLIPPHCVEIVHFDHPGHPDGKGGVVWNGVHGVIRPLAECWKYRGDVIRVDNGRIRGE